MSALLLRAETVDGLAKWRPFIDLKPSTLCAQFGLDEHRVLFDLPRSAYEVASGGSILRDGRSVGGFILDRTTRKPIGKLFFAREGEKFRDADPTNQREFERL